MSFRKVAENGKLFLGQYNRSTWYWKAASRVTIAATGITAKLALETLFKTETRNLDILLEAYRTSKIESRGLVTVMNHTTVVDEPLVWGVLPYRHLLHRSGVRWALGAENICFKNRFLGLYFSLGQVLATSRFGAGPFQGCIDAAIHMVSPDTGNYSASSTGGDDVLAGKNAEWVHIFPETFVHQPLPPHENTIRYFHWGVSRILLEATRPPIVVPLFTHGLEKVAPEDNLNFSGLRSRLGKDVTFNVGLPLDEGAIADYRQEWLNLVKREQGDISLDGANIFEDLNDNLRNGSEAQSIRSRLARFVRQGVVDARAGLGFPPEREEFGDWEFWAKEHDVKVAGESGKYGKS